MLAAMEGAAFAGEKIHADSSGVFALSSGAQRLDLSGHSGLSLAAFGEAVLTGGLTVAEGAAYRFGGAGSLTIATQLSGNHGILVDGQGSTGSCVTFASASTDTGAVVVQGYDAAKADEGDVTLTFAADNALASASSVTLRNNAGMDLNGTNQSFNKLTGDAGSLIFDDKGGNTLTLNVADTQQFSLRVQAAGTDVVKSGSGTLILSGEQVWKSFSVSEGSVQVADGKSLGYLSSGSQGIAVNIQAGASLHVAQGDSCSNTFNVAGFGVDNQSWALSTPGKLGNGAGVLNVVGDAAISGQFSFKTLNLQGNALTVAGGISAAEWSAKGGTLVLDNASFKVHKGRFDGSLSIGAGGATIEYPWDDKSEEAFTVAGFVSGTAADSLLRLVGYKHTMNLTGGVALAGKVEVGNGLTLNITGDATVGALVNEANVGDLSTVKVDAATLRIIGSGNNFGSNGNAGTIELTNGGQLQLVGLENGSSMGTLGSLQLGTDGVLSLSGFTGYTGGTALMNIAGIEGTRTLQIDPLCLGSLEDGATYHLLTSANELSGWTLLNSSVAGTRQNLELIAGGADGAYTLDLKVTGLAAAATWQGTGTLVAGQANAANLSSTAGDNTFMAQDSLTISSEAGANDTLTLGGEIAAASVTYTGAGAVTLALQDGGKFAAGVDVVVDGAGSFVLGDTQAISGEIVLKQGTLSGSSTSLNGTKGIRVTGDAHFELTSASHVTAGINIEKGKTLALTFKDDSMADEWGGNLDNNLSGNGKLLVNLGTETKGTGNELHLNGDHSAFLGDIEVQSGTLQLGMREDNGQLLTSNLGAGRLSFAKGTSLSLSSAATTLAADIDWAGGSTLHVKDGAESGVAYTLSGKQTLGGALSVSAAASKAVHISGDISGAGSLNFTGASTFILSGNNTYSGGTTLNNSGLTLYASGSNALGSGAVTGSNGRLVKTGAGTLTIGDFSFSGSTHVEQGTLALTLNNGKSSWYTGFSGDEGATLRLSTAYRYGTYLMGAMSGGMALELEGHFALSASNTHTGGTKLLSGSLQIGNVNALQSGALYAATGTQVSIATENTCVVGDSVVDALDFLNGASVLVGADAEVGSLSFGSLSGSASFLLDIFSADSYDRLSGTLTPGSLLSVNLMASELGNYLLVEGDNSGYDTSTISYSGATNSEHIYLWSSSERGITLSIQDASVATDANVWTGGSIGTWDASGAGWYGDSFSADKKALFIANDSSTISVGAAVTTTTLEAEVAEDATLCFGSKEGGSISATTLQKDGAGTLSFASGMGNSFSSVVVNDGTLSISAANGNPLGTVMISGSGTFELTGGSLRADLNAGAMAVKNIRLDGGALTLYSTAYWGTAISGRIIEIEGDNSSLALEKWANLNGSAITLRDGGTIYTGNNGLGNDSGTIYVDKRGFIKAGNAGDGNLAADISGKGTLTIADWNGGKITLGGDIKDAEDCNLALVYNHNNVHINDIYDDSGKVTSSPLNTYSGGTTIIGGSVTTYKETALGAGIVTINGGTLTLASNLTIGSLSGTGGAIEVGGNTFSINQAGAGSFAGNISGSGAVSKSGTGTLTLSGTNSVASVNLLAGRLVAASDGALGSGMVTFSAGASLYVANNAKVGATLAGGNYLIGAESGQAGSFTGDAAASLLASGFTKEGAGKVAVTNSSGQNPAGAMVVNAGILAYDAGSSTTLGTVSGSGTFTLVGGAVNASNINVGKLVVDKSVLAYSSTFDGKALEVSGPGAELRMGHWASVNNSTLLLKDGGQLSMSSSGFNNSSVMVEGSGTLAVGETASKDDKPLLNVESSISGSGTLYVTDYGTGAYTVNVNKAIADSSKGSLAITADQSDLHFTVANTYSGGTTINGGKLTAEVTGALGGGSLTINGGEFVAKAAGSIGGGDVTLNGGKLTLDLGETAQLFYMDNVSGTGGIVDIGKNTLVINQTKNASYNGSFSAGDAAMLLKRGDATLELGGTATSLDLQIDSGTVKLAGSHVFASGGLVKSVVTLKGGVFDINGQTSYNNNALHFDVESGYIAFRGDDDMLVKDSSGATSGLGFYTAYQATAVGYYGTGRAEISANIVNSGQASPSHRMEFKVNSAGKGSGFTELTLSGNIGADHSADERYKFGISKTGAGAMMLSGNNGYAGGTMVTEGTLIAGSNSALGSGYVDVASGATLEIAAGTQVGGLTYGVLFREGSELKLHSLSTEVAALTTTGANIQSSGGNWSGVVNSMVLTLAEDIRLDAVSGYKVLSLGSYARDDMDASRVSVNYLGDGRYTFSTRYESSTLYLDVTQDAAATLVWGGTAESDTWNQSSQNKNWNAAGDASGNNSFMNQDSVSFTADAAHKAVAVAESGVQVNSMTVSGADYSFSGGAVKAESVTVEEGATMNMGAVYTLAQKAAESAAGMGKVEMGSDADSLTGYIHGAVAGELSALDNVVIDIAKGATLELKDILLTDSSRITDDPATVAVENVTVALSEANSILEGTSTLNIGTELVPAGGGASFVLMEETSIVSVFSSALDTVNVTGTSLTIDLSGLATTLGTAWQENQYVAISFGQTQGSLAHFDVSSGLSISASYGGSSYAVYVNSAEQDSAATLYVSTASDAIPEPTTATLSLLALSLLAARRRRK